MEDLLREIEAEKEHISATLQALEKTFQRKEQTVIEFAAIAVFLQNAYNGMENILKRLLKYQKIRILSTESWHKDLLDLSLEHQIISRNTSQNLDTGRSGIFLFMAMA